MPKTPHQTKDPEVRVEEHDLLHAILAALNHLVAHTESGQGSYSATEHRDGIFHRGGSGA